MEAQTPTQGTGNEAAAQDHTTATWTELGPSLGLPISLETFWRCNYNDHWTKIPFLLIFSMILISGAELGPHKRVRKAWVQSQLPKVLVNAYCISPSWEGLHTALPFLNASVHSSYLNIYSNNLLLGWISSAPARPRNSLFEGTTWILRCSFMDLWLQCFSKSSCPSTFAWMKYKAQLCREGSSVCF